MKLIKFCLLILFLVAFITSCKKSVPKQTKFIPKNAVFVATINTKSLQAKLVKNQATIENIIRSISGSDTTVSKGRQEWQEIQSSGIDLDENVYIAVTNKGAGIATGKGSIVTSIIGSMEDEKKLVAYIQKKAPGSEVRKEKNYSYTTIKGDKIVAWGKDVVMLMSYQNSFGPGDMEYDSTTGSFNLRNPGNAANDMKTEIESNFNLKEEQSVASVPEFRDLMQEKSDATMWVNSSASTEGFPLPLPKAKELFSNSFTAAKVDFEDGKIAINSKSYYSKELRDILKNYSGPTADLSLVENYPSNNINGFAVFSFNPEFINGLVKFLEVGALVDGYLSKMMGGNYTLQDALKTIKGDFAVIVSDFTTMHRADSATGMRRSEVPNVKMIVNIPVGDKAQMNRLMEKLVEMQMLVKANNEYTLTPALQQTGFQLRVDDKNLFLATDQNLLNDYRAGSKKANLNTDVISDFKGKSGVAYVNIESMLNGIPSDGNGQLGEVLPKAKETFKDIKAFTDNFNGKHIEGHAEIRFKNEKENSLTSLLGFIETVSKRVQKGSSMPDAVDDAQADTSALALRRK